MTALTKLGRRTTHAITRTIRVVTPDRTMLAMALHPKALTRVALTTAPAPAPARHPR